MKQSNELPVTVKSPYELGLKHDELMLRFRQHGIEVNIYWNGGERTSYSFFIDGIVAASGNDFRPSPIHYIDDINSMVSLLGFLTVRKGDTDDEYFKDHSVKHLEWLDGNHCEDLRLLIDDFDSNSQYSSKAVKFFKKHIELYPMD